MSWRETPDEPFVHEAARTVIDQTGCTEDEAFAKLDACAARLGRTVAETAMMTVEGLIRFDE